MEIYDTIFGTFMAGLLVCMIVIIMGAFSCAISAVAGLILGGIAAILISICTKFKYDLFSEKIFVKFWWTFGILSFLFIWGGVANNYYLYGTTNPKGIFYTRPTEQVVDNGTTK